MPTEHAFRATWAKLKRRLAAHEAPLLHTSGLDPASLASIPAFQGSPQWDPMLEALDAQFGEWANDESADARLRAIVIPPCDTTEMLTTWAHARGHALLNEPSRFALANLPLDGVLQSLQGDGLLVIPRLEKWFLRDRNGLHAVRSLIAQLATSGRRCLIGCDSWAWRYLVKAADVDLSLSNPQTLEPFDARRLCEWFTTLARDADGVTTTFRLAGNGYDVLACNENGEPHNAYLRQLAARSGGIPWVAWHLWRAGLRLSAGEKPLSDRAVKATAGDARTVWIIDVADVRLPPTNVDRSLLVLQALLIHGGLTATEVEAVLPTTGEPNMLVALTHSGHLQRSSGSALYRIQPAAYPAIRQALKAAGLPTGVV